MNYAPLLALALACMACAEPPPPVAPPPPAPVVTPPAPAPPAPAPAPPPPEPQGPPTLSEEALMAHLSHLASAELRGRKAYSDDEVAAADYVVAELERRHVAAPAMGRRQPFAENGLTSLNVLGLIRCEGCPRPDEIVVVGAHLDHMGDLQGKMHLGAEDNASGVAVVLEIARALQEDRTSLGRSVMVAFFGAEEVGLVGSRYLARHLPPEPVVAMVNVDMVGRKLADRVAFGWPKSMLGIDDVHSVGMLGVKGRPSFRKVVDEACEAAGLRAIAPENLGPLLAGAVRNMARGRGDNWSFEAVGIPSLFFSSGESDDYHMPTDTVDRIQPAILAARAQAILGTVRGLSTLEPADLKHAPLK